MSTSTLQPSRPQPHRWAPAQVGWIGVDIGFRETRVSQLERRGERTAVRAEWQFPTPASPETPLWDNVEETFARIAEELGSLRSMFRGPGVALTLPFDQTPLRLIDVPRSDPGEMRCMIREELAAEFPDEEPCFDYWETTPQSRGETASLAVTMLPAPRAQKIARLIAAQRLDCHVIDSGLCALARATRESVPRCSGEEATTLAVDLGWTSTRLLLTQRGEPRFCRVLPESGCRHWVQRLVERFQLREKEAWSVLEQLGVGSTESSKRLGPAGEIRACLEPALLQLTHELQRTMQFVRRQLPEQLPRSVCLFGGGARIRCIETKLAEHLQLPTACWQPSASTSSRTDARASGFATARALSALAWEEQ